MLLMMIVVRAMTIETVYNNSTEKDSGIDGGNREFEDIDDGIETANHGNSGI